MKLFITETNPILQYPYLTNFVQFLSILLVFFLDILEKMFIDLQIFCIQMFATISFKFVQGWIRRWNASSFAVVKRFDGFSVIASNAPNFEHMEDNLLHLKKITFKVYFYKPTLSLSLSSNSSQSSFSNLNIKLSIQINSPLGKAFIL